MSFGTDTERPKDYFQLPPHPVSGEVVDEGVSVAGGGGVVDGSVVQLGVVSVVVGVDAAGSAAAGVDGAGVLQSYEVVFGVEPELL